MNESNNYENLYNNLLIEFNKFKEEYELLKIQLKKYTSLNGSKKNIMKITKKYYSKNIKNMLKVIKKIYHQKKFRNIINEHMKKERQKKWKNQLCKN